MSRLSELYRQALAEDARLRALLVEARAALEAAQPLLAELAALRTKLEGAPLENVHHFGPGCVGRLVICPPDSFKPGDVVRLVRAED